jgi:hypothetical protein
MQALREAPGSRRRNVADTPNGGECCCQGHVHFPKLRQTICLSLGKHTNRAAAQWQAKSSSLLMYPTCADSLHVGKRGWRAK